jgi:hypothetical protein
MYLIRFKDNAERQAFLICKPIMLPDIPGTNGGRHIASILFQITIISRVAPVFGAD